MMEVRNARKLGKICEKVGLYEVFGGYWWDFGLYWEVVSGDNVGMKKALADLATRYYREERSS